MIQLMQVVEVLVNKGNQLLFYAICNNLKPSLGFTALESYLDRWLDHDLDFDPPFRKEVVSAKQMHTNPVTIFHIGYIYDLQICDFW